jgi:hypothetical protein
MTIIAIVLSAAGLGFLCWLLFTLAVYALPFFVGVTAGFAAYHSGAGFVGTIVVALLVGAITLVAGQAAFASVRSPAIRTLIALVFAVPAAIAGYHATFGLSQIGVSAESWRVVFGIVGAICVGGTALARLTLFDPPGTVRGNEPHSAASA